MTFTKAEFHDMNSRHEAIGHKLIDGIATKEEAEEYLRLNILLKRYRYTSKIIIYAMTHPIHYYIAWKYTTHYARSLLHGP